MRGKMTHADYCNSQSLCVCEQPSKCRKGWEAALKYGVTARSTASNKQMDAISAVLHEWDTYGTGCFYLKSVGVAIEALRKQHHL
jgi:hypothetical protein